MCLWNTPGHLPHLPWPIYMFSFLLPFCWGLRFGSHLEEALIKPHHSYYLPFNWKTSAGYKRYVPRDRILIPFFAEQWFVIHGIFFYPLVETHGNFWLRCGQVNRVCSPWTHPRKSPIGASCSSGYVPDLKYEIRSQENVLSGRSELNPVKNCPCSII